ncbi:MAG TPA: hypothetical protein VF202_01035 [Trueperaceae bacterium]
MDVKTAAQGVETALRGAVPKLRVHTDLGATVDPPAAVVGPPQLTWTGYGRGPNLARFLVYVIVAADDRALERLWDLVPQVAAALEASEADITVTQANPARWPAGGVDLPAYEITTEVAL